MCKSDREDFGEPRVGGGGGGMSLGPWQSPSDTAGLTLVSETMSVLSAKGGHYSLCDSVL